MSDATKFILPDCAGMTPSDVMSMVNNGGGFGGGNSWMWFLLILLIYGRNGFGTYSNCDANVGTNLTMQAIQGNKEAIGNLSTMLNCDLNTIQTALGTIQSTVQLSNCQQTNAIQNSINCVANSISKGFGDSNYEAAARTCDLKNALKDAEAASTAAIIGKLDSMEARATQDKISSLMEKNSTLTTQINLQNQNAVFAQMLAPIQAEISAIKAAQPATVSVPYPQLTAVPSAYLYGNYGANVFTNGQWA